MCVEEPNQIYLGESNLKDRNWVLDFNIEVNQDCDEVLKKQIKELDKHIVLFSRSHAYLKNEYGEQTVQPIVKKTFIT